MIGRPASLTHVVLCCAMLTDKTEFSVSPRVRDCLREEHDLGEDGRITLLEDVDIKRRRLALQDLES